MIYILGKAKNKKGILPLFIHYFILQLLNTITGVMSTDGVEQSHKLTFKY